jgi:hypothetical protein
MRAAAVLAALAALACAGQLWSRDWYVSAARGSGKQGTKEQPAKDLGNIISLLAPGDAVYVAAGTYTGKGDSGVDLINVPVTLSGGWSDDFSARDPWGASKTVLSGDNKTKNWVIGARIEFDLSKYKEKISSPIAVDGFIVDQGAQNRYKDASQKMILRKADPATGANPTQERGAIFIRVSQAMEDGKTWDIKVVNNVVVNSAPTMGAIAVFAYAGDKVRIANNAVINCTGTGILAGTSWRGSELARAPKYTVEDNTILFIWKYDAYVQSFSGVGFGTDTEVSASLARNVIGFTDRFSVQKLGKWPLLMKDNVLSGAVDSTYYEAYTDMKIDMADLEDEAETLDPASGGNANVKFPVAASAAWKEVYGQRVLIDRNAVEADIQGQKTRANEVRSILGLPARADDVKADSPVWLHRMSLEDALAIAISRPVAGKGAGKDLIK